MLLGILFFENQPFTALEFHSFHEAPCNAFLRGLLEEFGPNPPLPPTFSITRASLLLLLLHSPDFLLSFSLFHSLLLPSHIFIDHSFESNPIYSRLKLD